MARPSRAVSRHRRWWYSHRHPDRSWYAPVYEVRALGGSDVTRETTTVTLYVEADVLWICSGWGAYGEPCEASLAGPLSGWGILDCAESVDLQPAGCAWSVQVPLDVIRALVLRHRIQKHLRSTYSVLERSTAAARAWTARLSA